MKMFGKAIRDGQELAKLDVKKSAGDQLLQQQRLTDIGNRPPNMQRQQQFNRYKFRERDGFHQKR